MTFSSACRFALAAVAVLAASPASAQPGAPPAPTTGVLTMLTVKADAPLAELMKVRPNEVRETVRLYLDGKIAQWYGRSDGKGVIFILNASTVDEAKAITDMLPLSKANFATFEYIPLTPLTPLRLLTAQPPSPPKE